MQRFKLISGLVMLVASIVLACLFLFPAFHFQWWSDNTYFLVLTIIGVFFAILGSFLVRSFIYRGKEKESLISDILGHVGFLLVAGAVLLGGAALLVAMDVNTNTGVGVDEFGAIIGPVYDKALHYPEDFLVMDSQVLLLCFSIAAAILGQFMIGFSRERTAD